MTSRRDALKQLSSGAAALVASSFILRHAGAEPWVVGGRPRGRAVELLL